MLPHPPSPGSLTMNIGGGVHDGGNIEAIALFLSLCAFRSLVMVLL